MSSTYLSPGSPTSGGTLPAILGAAVGLVSSMPAALLAFLVFGTDAETMPIAGAAVGSGVMTGATFGRGVAAKPTLASLLLAPAGSALIGAAMGVLIHEAMYGVTGHLLGAILLSLTTNTIPGYITMALPCFLLGVAITRRIPQLPWLSLRRPLR